MAGLLQGPLGLSSSLSPRSTGPGQKLLVAQIHDFLASLSSGLKRSQPRRAYSTKTIAEHSAAAVIAQRQCLPYVTISCFASRRWGLGSQAASNPANREVMAWAVGDCILFVQVSCRSTLMSAVKFFMPTASNRQVTAAVQV